MKRQNEIPHTCALCKHAVFSYPSASSDTPPLARFLNLDASDEECVSITCPYKKEASAFFSCRRFKLDPLKYRPKKAPPIQSLDADSLLLDDEP